MFIPKKRNSFKFPGVTCVWLREKNFSKKSKVSVYVNVGYSLKILCFRENSSTKLWRRISIMNPPARRSENQIDVLGTTTWGVRKVNFLY